MRLLQNVEVHHLAMFLFSSHWCSLHLQAGWAVRVRSIMTIGCMRPRFGRGLGLGELGLGKG